MPTTREEGILLRAVTWNLQFRVGDSARRQGELLGSLVPAPDIVLLQEVNRRAIETLCVIAGLTWFRCAVDIRVAEPDDTPVRRRGVAIAGRGEAPFTTHLRLDVPLPERILVAKIPTPGGTLTVISYHAPPGVNWHEKKPQQAVAFARWLATVKGPVVLGIDANTPRVDAIDFVDTRTHWHTGMRKLKGAPGDDLLVGPNRIHKLDDALRRWLANHPHDLEQIRQVRPFGPLAVSHRTGRRKTHPGTDRRFDSIWVSPEIEVRNVGYLDEEALAAGSDHAAVVADLVLHNRGIASSLCHRV